MEIECLQEQSLAYSGPSVTLPAADTVKHLDQSAVSCTILSQLYILTYHDKSDASANESIGYFKKQRSFYIFQFLKSSVTRNNINLRQAATKPIEQDSPLVHKCLNWKITQTWIRQLQVQKREDKYTDSK